MNLRPEAIKRVLIVDDSSTMRALLDVILSEDPGFQVIGLARSAREAMALVESARPHLLVTDLVMPDIDGEGLLTMLVEHLTLCKVVVSTRSNLSEAMELRLTALGASAIFDKQDIARDPKTFLAALHQAAMGRGTARPLVADRAATSDNVIQAAARFPVPPDETARARAVRALNITNLDVDPRLNILARHLARLSDYPIAAVNVIGSDQLWIKAAVGVVPSVVLRGDAICAHAICRDGMTVITDTLADPILRNSSAVTGGLKLRSYVGAPIISEKGARLGMVCVADTRPRLPTKEQLQVVADVAALVATALHSPIPQLRPAAYDQVRPTNGGKRDPVMPLAGST